MYSTPKLSKEELIGVIIGMMLGDGYLFGDKQKCLTIVHSPAQREYLDFKVSILTQLTAIHRYDRIVKFKNGKKYPLLCIVTRHHPVYTKIYRILYRDGRKAVTKEVLRKLTILGLAIWFMDDGSLTLHYKRNKNGQRYIAGVEYNLHTEGFSYEENLLIKSYLKEALGIEAKVHRTKGKYWKIYMNGTQGRKFAEIIAPYVIPSMEYKLFAEKKRLLHCGQLQ